MWHYNIFKESRSKGNSDYSELVWLTDWNNYADKDNDLTIFWVTNVTWLWPQLKSVGPFFIVIKQNLKYVDINESAVLVKWSYENTTKVTTKMGDLYPIIEGPVKFRDGKKVFFHKLKIMMNTYLKKKEFEQLFLRDKFHFNISVEITICERDEAISCCK